MPPPHDILTLSLHDALPISRHALSLLQRGTLPFKNTLQIAKLRIVRIKLQTDCQEFLCALKLAVGQTGAGRGGGETLGGFFRDRKSTRLNSSHLGISYAVFC